MTLPWVRLETGFPDHPKVLALAGEGQHRAILVYVCALAWSGRHQTDGYIPRAALGMIHGRPVDAAHLVTHRLWADCGSGWVIPDWSDYQQMKATTDGRAEKGKLLACRRWHPQPCDTCNALRNALRNA